MAICSNKAKHPFCFIKILHGIVGAHINIFSVGLIGISERISLQHARQNTKQIKYLNKIFLSRTRRDIASWNRATSRYLTRPSFTLWLNFRRLVLQLSINQVMSAPKRYQRAIRKKFHRKKKTLSRLSNASDVAWTQTAFINNIFNNHFIAA